MKSIRERRNNMDERHKQHFFNTFHYVVGEILNIKAGQLTSNDIDFCKHLLDISKQHLEKLKDGDKEQ
jgi:hypothetical protein